MNREIPYFSEIFEPSTVECLRIAGDFSGPETGGVSITKVQVSRDMPQSGELPSGKVQWLYDSTGELKERIVAVDELMN